VQNTATGRKHRLKTLGLLETYTKALEQWKRIARRSQELEAIYVEKGKQIVKEIGFKEDIKETLKDKTDREDRK